MYVMSRFLLIKPSALISYSKCCFKATTISQVICNSVSNGAIMNNGAVMNNEPKAEHHVIDEDTVIGEIAMS